MVAKPMKTLTFGNTIYEIVDAVARNDLEEVQNKLNTIFNGEGGRSIVSIDKTGVETAEDGRVIDTYTITYTDGINTVFTVTNGKNGEDGSFWWTATIPYTAMAGSTSIHKTQINPVESREIAVGDLVLFNDGVVRRVTTIGTSSVVTEDTGVILKGDSFTFEDFTEEQLENLKGDTPQKGVDYWTEADKQELIEEIEIPTEVIVTEIDENPDTIPDDATLQIVIDDVEYEEILTDYINNRIDEKIPTKISDLENDSNYLTETALNETLSEKKYVNEDYVIEAINTAFANIKRAEDGEY